MTIPTASRRWQFNVNSLLTFTTCVAVLLTLIPLACGLPFELLCVLTIPLIAAAAYSDAVEAQSRRIPRWAISLAMGSVAIGQIYQSFARVPYAVPTWFLWPALWMIAGAFLSMVRCPLPKTNGRLHVSSLALLINAALMVWRFYDTTDDRYFVQRHCTQSEAPVISRDGALYIKGGDVDFSLGEYVRKLPDDDRSEFRTLYNAANQPWLYAPFTQLRLLTSVAYIGALSFRDETTVRDWENLSHQAQLAHLSFSRLKITEAQIRSFESLTNVHHVAFFNCELPPKFAGAAQKSSSLYILQVSDCRTQGFEGLSKNAALRTLVLRNITGLTNNDLAELASLFLLTDVHLRGTALTNDQLLHWAKCLSSALGKRQGRFTLIIDANATHLEGLRALIQTGAISKLKLPNCKLSEEELKELSIIDAAVAITPLP